jgi:hypothetical protein
MGSGTCILASALPSHHAGAEQYRDIEVPIELAFRRQWFSNIYASNSWREMTCVIAVTGRPKSTE